MLARPHLTAPPLSSGHLGLQLKGKTRVKEAPSSDSETVLPCPLPSSPPLRGSFEPWGFSAHSNTPPAPPGSPPSLSPDTHAPCTDRMSCARHCVHQAALRGISDHFLRDVTGPAPWMPVTYGQPGTAAGGARLVPKWACGLMAKLGSSNIFPKRSFSTFWVFVFEENRTLNAVWCATIPMKTFLVHCL